MRYRIAAVLMACACLVSASRFIDAASEPEPLWAYGFLTPPAPGDAAAPQAPPTRNLRPNEDPLQQTRMRHVEASTAEYSLVDVRDGSNVIDWFPSDHPMPM